MLSKLFRRKPAAPTPDMGEAFAAHFAACRPFTMTSPARMHALHEAVRYVIHRGIPGDIVECGVWRGGSMMLAARTLLAEGEVRRLWLFDTFEGMTEPSDADFDLRGRPAAERYHEGWCEAGEDEVRENLLSTGYPADLTTFVRGKVEDTIPGSAPERIALLRLDTDFYESTAHELAHLYPRLSPGGVLIVDDYGHWQGARRAVDEYFASAPILLTRVDYTGRVAVKT